MNSTNFSKGTVLNQNTAQSKNELRELPASVRNMRLARALNPDVIQKLNSKQIGLLYQELLNVDFGAALHFAKHSGVSTSKVIRGLSSEKFRERNPEIWKLARDVLAHEKRNNKSFGERARILIADLERGTDLSLKNRPQGITKNFLTKIRKHGLDLVKNIKLVVAKPQTLSPAVTKGLQFVKQINSLLEGQYRSADLEKQFAKNRITINPEQQKLLTENSIINGKQLANITQDPRLAINPETQKEISLACRQKKLDMVYDIQRKELIKDLLEEIQGSGLLKPNQAIYEINGDYYVDRIGGEGRLVCQATDLTVQSELNLWNAKDRFVASEMLAIPNKSTSFKGSDPAHKIQDIVFCEGPEQYKIYNRSENPYSGQNGFEGQRAYLGKPTRVNDGIAVPTQNVEGQIELLVFQADGQTTIHPIPNQKYPIMNSGANWIACLEDSGNAQIVKFELIKNSVGQLEPKFTEELFALDTALQNRKIEYLQNISGDSLLVATGTAKVGDRIFYEIQSFFNGQRQSDSYMEVHNSFTFRSSSVDNQEFIVSINNTNDILSLTLNLINPPSKVYLTFPDHNIGDLQEGKDGRTYLYARSNDGAFNLSIFEITVDGAKLVVEDFPLMMAIDAFTYQDQVYLISSEFKDRGLKALYNKDGKRVSPYYQELALDQIDPNGNLVFNVQIQDEFHQLTVGAMLDSFQIPKNYFAVELLDALQKGRAEGYREVDREFVSMMAATSAHRNQQYHDKELLSSELATSLNPTVIKMLEQVFAEDPSLLDGQIPVEGLNFKVMRELLSEAIPEMNGVIQEQESKLDLIKKWFDEKFQSRTPEAETWSPKYEDLENLKGGNPRSDLLDKTLVLQLSQSYHGFLAGALYFGFDPSLNKYIRSAPSSQIAENLSEGITATIPSVSKNSVFDLLQPIGGRITTIESVNREENKFPLANDSGQDNLRRCVSGDKTNEIDYQFAYNPEQTLSIVNTQEANEKLKASSFLLSESAEPRVALPENLQNFADSIRTEKPLTQIKLIKSFVHENLYYDIDNGDVSEEKANASLARRLEIMSERMNFLRAESSFEKSIPAEKCLAGVCADAAELSSLLMAEVGIASGVAIGFQVSGKDVTAGDAHAIAVAALPGADGLAVLIEVDSTPALSIGAQISMPNVVFSFGTQAEKEIVALTATDEVEIENSVAKTRTENLNLTQEELVILAKFSTALLYSREGAEALNSGDFTTVAKNLNKIVPVVNNINELEATKVVSDIIERLKMRDLDSKEMFNHLIAVLPDTISEKTKEYLRSI